MELNKKYLSIIIGILAITLISAAIITQYGLFKTNIEIIQPISTEGILENDLSGIVLDEYPKFIWGEKITIFNIADKDIDVQIVSNNNESEIEVRYVRSENGLFDYVDIDVGDIGLSSNDITLTIDANSNLSFYPQYIISKPLESGTYTITTSVNPIA